MPEEEKEHDDGLLPGQKRGAPSVEKEEGFNKFLSPLGKAVLEVDDNLEGALNDLDLDEDMLRRKDDKFKKDQPGWNTKDPD